MKTLLRFAALLLASVPIGLPKVWAQTPSLEFAAGAGNPTGNGPVVSQLITFQNNTNNPTGTTFAAVNPAVTATFTLSNQQYTQANTSTTNLISTGTSTGVGMAIGSIGSTTTAGTLANAIFPLLSSIGGSANTDYQSANGVSGGIDIATNRAIEIFNSVQPLPATVGANQRYYYGDLTITYSQAIENPVIHVTGLGGSYSNGTTTNGFSAELDLLNPPAGLSLVGLTGRGLTITSTQILNNTANPGTATGSGAGSGTVLVNTPAGGVTSISFRLYVRTLNAGGAIHPTNGTGHAGDVWLISTSARSAPVLSGYVFEDVNYGGGAGRPFATAGAVGRPNARVELYNSTTGAFVASTTTDADGQYTFNVANGSYTVRVVNSTVTSSRTLNANFTAANTSAVQTFNGTTSRVGGQNPALVDAAANSGSQLLSALTGTGATPQSIASITTSGLATDGPDFGYNFDLVVNTNDGGQGSLRQFINNANALSNSGLAQVGQTAGVESSIFMIPDGAAHPGVLAATAGGPASQLNSSGVAVITPASALPALTDANTAINGTTQTANIGNTNTGTLGLGGTVGTGATTLGTVNRPEVQIVGSTARAIGLDVSSSATGSAITGLAIYGFGNGTDNNDNANIRVAANNTIITGNVIGNSATNFSSAAPVATAADNVRIIGGGNVQITNNLIGYANGKGVAINAGVTGTTVSGNEIRSNALTAAQLDGVDIQGSSATITNNLIVNNSGQGVDSFNSSGNNTITGNTIAGNGVGNNETAGVRIYGANSTIQNNIISDNYGAGVMVTPGASNAIIQQNAIFNNGAVTGNGNIAATGQIGIDLLNGTDDVTKGSGTFVTLNDDGDGDTGANGLLNMPIIQSVTIRNGFVNLTGFAKAGANIEFFIAKPNPTTPNATGANFGQGQIYLFSATEGANGVDRDAAAATYSGNVNGFNQGTETNQNRFAFSFPLSSLTPAQRTALTTSGTLLTATATIGGLGTSEFSGNAPVYQAPVAVNDATTTTLGTAVTLTVTGNDQNNIDPATVSLNGLGAGSTTSVSVTGGSFQFLSNGQVRFTPAAGFTGVATVPYTVNNTSGVASNTAFISVEVRNPSIDLATNITAPTNNTAINGGAALTYTVTAVNNTATAASSVVETLQLPAGLGTVTITGGQNAASASYNNTTGLVTIPVGTLAASSTQTYNVAVTAMPGTGPITATANISGAVTETNTANNSATTTVTVNPRYDVTTTITGPAMGVVRGNEVTYTVTTSNLSTTAGSASPAPNVVQVVQLPTGLTGVFASNGGTYNSADGKVTFPAIGSLPLGQTVVNSISFAAPSANFTVPSATVTSGASNNNAGDLNSPSAGTNNNTAYLNGLASTASVTTVAPDASPVNVYNTITSSASSVAPGTAVTLTVTAFNAGPNTALGMTQTLQLPAGLTGFNASSGGSYNSATGLVTFNAIGNLPPASSSQVVVGFNAPAQGFVLASATVSTTSTDLVAADNLVQTKIEVTPVTDVATTLAGPTTVSPGQYVTYAVTTSNAGDAPANGVVQTVSLPAGLSGVTLSGNGSYDPATGLATFTFANALVKGETQTNNISFTVPSGAVSYTTAANVRSTTPETTVSNNAATLATAVQAAVDLAVVVSGPSTAPVSSAVTYSVVVTNNGPSTATTVTPTLQLPAGLDLLVNNNTGSYSPSTGLVTFNDVASLLSGASVTRTVTFLMPDASSVNGVARVTSATAELKADNNFASVATTGAAQNNVSASLGTSITASATSVLAGAQATVTANFFNDNGAGTAVNVKPSIALPKGLTGVSVSGGTGGSYDSNTGLVTWNSVATLAAGASLPTDTYKVTFNVPTSGSVTAWSIITGDGPEAYQTNNTASTTINVTPSADVATSVSGPAVTQPGATVTYAVTTLNNGVSPASSTQTVRIPATATNISYPAGGSQSAASGGFITVTFPAISNQPVGVAGEITNYVSFTAPSTPYSVNAVLVPGSLTGDVAGNNSVTVNTSINRAPVASNVVNTQQTPEANTAGPLLLSPLAATDADGNTLTYTITALPATAAGRLYLGTGTGSPVTLNQQLTAAQIGTLYFDPAAGFIGNAFFSYTATDDATTPLVSNTAIYTIPVGQDVNSVYTAAPAKGGSLATAYQNGDLIAAVLDANAARYNSSGAMYDFAAAYNNSSTPNPTGRLVGSDNGVRSASTDAAGTNTLNTLGLTLDPTNGEIRVTDRTKLNLRSGSYTINVTTVDANGGTNTVPVTFTIGFGPLPVTLVDFTAKAQGEAALLTWKTAQEKNNDHFDVERSIDGVHFEKVGQVAGHGTTTSAQQYSFSDATAARQASTVYYRLQQVDTDGTTTASDVRVVSFGKSAGVELTLFPNPASETLNIRLDGAAGNSQVTVYSAAGALVLQGKLAGSLSTAFDVRALPAGTYLVKVQAANGQPLTRRFVKY